MKKLGDRRTTDRSSGRAVWAFSNHPFAWPYHFFFLPSSTPFIRPTQKRTALRQGQRGLERRQRGFGILDRLLGSAGCLVMTRNLTSMIHRLGIAPGEVDRLADHGLGLSLATAVQEDLDQPDPLLKVGRLGGDGLPRELLGVLEITIANGIRHRLPPQIAGELRLDRECY